MKNFTPFLAVFLLAACGRHEAASDSVSELPSISVKVRAARLEPYVAAEEVVGTVRSKLRAILEAKVSGRVMEYLAVPGELVKSGDLLASLEVEEIQAKLDQAKAMLAQAQLDFDRQKHLVASNATTRQEFDAADARLKVAAAGVHEAETMLSYARVTAPFNGVVTRKLADVGDLAMPGKPLVEIEAPTSLRFEADLPETLLDRVTLGARLVVKVASMPVPMDAIVSEIAPIADPVSRTFLVKLDLPQLEGLRTGQFGRVAVPVAETKVLLVPQAAVMKRGQMELLYVIKDGHAALRLVKTGTEHVGGVEVLSGLEVGEQVVVGDITKLADGQPVTILP